MHRHDRPGDCHAFFFLDRLADTQPDFPVPRRLLLRGLERRYPEWLELDRSIIADASLATNDDVERVEDSFLATGSPEAWRAWQNTWRYPYRMPDPPWQLPVIHF